MGFKHPIIVVGCARSGGSLVADIIHSQGIWFGGTGFTRDQRHPHGDFVNKTLSRMQGRHHREGVPMNPRRVLELITDQGYCGGPWGAKHQPKRWVTWQRFRPQFVCVRREWEAVYQSQLRSDGIKGKLRKLTKVTHHRTWKSQNRVMDWLLSSAGAVDAHPARIIAGDFSELKKLFSHIGHPFDPAAAAARIEREYWHYD